MNLENLKRSLAVVEAGLNKANLNGTFELGESFAVKTAVDNLRQLVVDLERTHVEKLKRTRNATATTEDLLPTVPEETVN